MTYRIVGQDCVYHNLSERKALIAAHITAQCLLEQHGELGAFKRGIEAEWYVWKNNKRIVLLSIEKED
jgi:hypothetical protein